jgi:hypothetical protein
MNLPKFKIVQEYGDDGDHTFFVNDTEVGRANHDSHGWEGMAAACSMFNSIAKELGIQVEIADE